MFPTAIFTPIHKGRRTDERGSPSKIEGNDSNENAIHATDKQASDHEAEDPSMLDEDEVDVNDVADIHIGQRSTFQQTPEVFEGSENRPVDDSRQSIKTAFDAKFDSLRPPLITPRPGRRSGGSSVRQRHLAVLTAIMHRCLLQYDYIRAAKAWSMILRSELDGHSVDLRYSHRWGLGAELLLRGPDRTSQPAVSSRIALERGSDVSKNPSEYFDATQVEKLEGYYDRLSLQYPYHKSFPDNVGPLDFHSAMFSLDVFACTYPTKPRADIRAITSENEEQDTRKSTYDALQRAREISERLGELTSSPPYSDSENYKKLKTMVDAWTADLAIAYEEISYPEAGDSLSE